MLLAAVAARAGQTVDLLSVGLTATVAGLIFMFERHVDAFGDATTFAVALAIVGASNLVLALKARAAGQEPRR